MRPVRCIGPLVPWACTYLKAGQRFGITLYATDPDQIIRDHAKELPGLSVEGRIVGIVDI